MTAVPGGVSQVRSSRPRPAVWWSATTTRPSGAPSWARRDDLGVGRVELVDDLDASGRASARGCRCRGGPCRGVGARPGPWSRGLACPTDQPSPSTARRTGGRTRVQESRERTARRRHRGAPSDIDLHTTAGKLADLERRLDEAVHAGSAKAIEKQHAKGRQTARERIEMLFDEGSFVELDELARHRSTAFGLEKTRPYGDGVITGYGTIDGRQACVFSQDFTRLRRLARRGLRREDRQGHGPGDEGRLPDHRHQRGRRRPHPGGRRLPRPLRRDLPPQRARLGRHPADQHDHGQLRRRPRLLPRGHRLHDHGRPDLGDVHHRPRRHQDRHRRGRHDGGPRRRAHPQHQVGQRPLHGRRRGRRASTTSRRCCPTCRRTTSTRPPSYDDGGRPRDHRPRPHPRHADPRRPQPALRHARRDHRGRSTTRSSSRSASCSRPT